MLLLRIWRGLFLKKEKAPVWRGAFPSLFALFAEARSRSAWGPGTRDHDEQRQYRPWTLAWSIRQKPE